MKGIVLSASLAAACAAAHAAPLRVELRKQASVEGQFVELGEIAGLSCATAPACSAAAAIVVARAPRPGYSVRLRREAVQRAIRAGDAAAEIVWEGADAVSVQAAVHAYDTRALADEAAAYLRDALTRDGYAVRIEPAETVADLALPAGAVTWRIDPLAPAQLLRKHVTVKVDVALDGHFHRSVKVPFTVTAQRTARVARHALARGQDVRCEDTAEETIDVAAIGAEVVSACDGALGRLKRPLDAGAALRKDELEEAPAVAQGDAVSLQLADGAVLLETRAVAVTDGRIGQKIIVKPLSGKDVVGATVVARNVVRVTGR